MAEGLQIAKTYTISNAGKWTTRNLECQHNGQPFLWIRTVRPSMFSSAPAFTIRNQSPEGPIIASAKYPTLGHGIRIMLGDAQHPSPTSPQQQQLAWSELDRSMCSREYRFFAPDGRAYVWRRTRNGDIGASGWSGRDYKLLEIGEKEGQERLVAVYIHKLKWLGSDAEGRVDWVEQMEPNVELFVLTAILVVQAVIRRRQRSGNAAAAASA